MSALQLIDPDGGVLYVRAEDIIGLSGAYNDTWPEPENPKPTRDLICGNAPGGRIVQIKDCAENVTMVLDELNRERAGLQIMLDENTIRRLEAAFVRGARDVVAMGHR